MNTVTTWNPLRDFGRLASLADSLFRTESTCSQNTCGQTASTPARTWSPAVNVSETDAGYLISAELPEVAAADVKVVVRDGVLTLSGERKQEKQTENEKFHLVERSYGSFSRSFNLPKNADGEKVAAEFRNGVLNVSVPKREEVKPREIEVKVG